MRKVMAIVWAVSCMDRHPIQLVPNWFLWAADGQVGRYVQTFRKLYMMTQLVPIILVPISNVKIM